MEQLARATVGVRILGPAVLDTAWATRCEDDDDRDDHVWPAAGHDAWVVGDEPVVFLDFAGAATYAKPS